MAVVAVYRILDRRWRVEVDDRGRCAITCDRALAHTAPSIERAAEWLRDRGVVDLIRD